LRFVSVLAAIVRPTAALQAVAWTFDGSCGLGNGDAADSARSPLVATG